NLVVRLHTELRAVERLDFDVRDLTVESNRDVVLCAIADRRLEPDDLDGVVSVAERHVRARHNRPELRSVRPQVFPEGCEKRTRPLELPKRDGKIVESSENGAQQAPSL